MKNPIIDCLTHISRGADDVVGWGPRFLAEDLIAQMDAPRKILGESARIDKAIVFPALGETIPTSGLSFKQQHEYVLESVRKYPDRMIGGAIIHARLWNEEVVAQLESMVREDNFRMLYIHPSFHKYWLPISTPSESEGSKQLLYPVFEFARQWSLPVLLHTGEPPYGLPATVEFVAGEFPDVSMIIAHMGTQGVVYTLESLLVAQNHPNVLLETSFTQCHMLIESVHSLGPERVLFGSNCPPMEPTQQLMTVEESLTLAPPIGMNLSFDDTRKVLGGNLAGLIQKTDTAAAQH